MKKICVYLGCLVMLIAGTWSSVHAEVTRVEFPAEAITVVGELRQDNGLPIHGIFDMRVTFWSNASVTSPAGGIRSYVENSSFLWFMEDQEVQVDNQGNFAFDVGHYSSINSVPPGDVYMQVDWKPAGTEYTHFAVLGGERTLIKQDALQKYKRENDATIFKGTLLDDDGRPLQGRYLARVSLWRSANYDTYYDQLEDTSFLASNANWYGYQMIVPLQVDQQGVFGIDLGFLKDRAQSLVPEDVFMQLDLMSPDPETGFEIMDPDGDITSVVDRFPFTRGQFSTDLESALLNPLGNSGKWLVTQVPSATSLNSFEVGATNTDPQAHIEIRANQGGDKKGVLRFNGITNRWEISSDGITFSEINAGYDNMLGVYSPTFTIGLGNDTEGPWELRFGDGGRGSILFDALKNTFEFSGDIDLGGNQLINAVLENRSGAPENPKPGQQYFNTSNNEAYFFDGSFWQPMSRNSDVFKYGVTGGGGGTTTIIQQVGGAVNGTDSSTFTVNQDGTPGNTNVDIVAEQGSEPNGTLRYNATTNQWELSNNGGVFSGIADLTSPQNFTNKTIDGALNTLKNIDFSSLSKRLKIESFQAGYPGVNLSADGVDNKGILRDERDDVSERNAYRWSTTQSTQQDYDLVVSWTLPLDFEEFSTMPITFDMRTESGIATDTHIDATFTDTSGALIPLVGCTDLTTATFNWEQKSCALGATAVLTPGESVSIRLKLHAILGSAAEIAEVRLGYFGK